MAEKTTKAPKMSQKAKVLDEAKQLVLEMRNKHEDWYNRKVFGKAYLLVKGAKKGKNNDISKC